MTSPTRYSPEVRERAVWLVLEHQGEHDSQWSTITSVASKLGCTAETLRKWLSGAPNGWIKEVLGFRRFSVRGLDKARGEWDLVCLALNIKRLQPLLAA